ncbi:MAG: iron ABC transporter permease [Ignavibacteria bacterium]|nr:iron ABC transporter permease [Ignavibacteria bacterium]
MSVGSKLTAQRIILYSAILFFLLIIVILMSLSFGAEFISPLKVFQIFFNRNENWIEYEIIFQLRLPRILTAAIVGASLSIVGVVFQALLKNPLSEPYILGVSSGGALGAILSISFGIHLIGISFFSFAGSLITFFIVYLFGRRFGEIEPNTILLIGVMINSFFSALILLIVSFLDQSFRTALFWLMGNLSLANYSSALLIFVIFIFSSIIFLVYSNQYNLISIDEENAKQFGVNTKQLKNLSLIFGSLLIGVVVANVGIIGFVGLVVPHICRLIFGYDNRIIIPTSIFIGAMFLILSDLISRILFAPMEIPIGSITAIIGSPIFIFLLKRKQFSNGG